MYTPHKGLSQRAVWKAFFMNLWWNVGWQIRKHEYWTHLQRFTLWVDTFNMPTKSPRFQMSARCLCVCIVRLRHVKMCVPDTLREHPLVPRGFRKHTLNTLRQIRCCRACCTTYKHGLVAFIRTGTSDWKGSALSFDADAKTGASSSCTSAHVHCRHAHWRCKTLDSWKLEHSSEKRTCVCAGVWQWTKDANRRQVAGDDIYGEKK